ncbi:uncharacterized protein MELLADRAFT_107857 [Melampsora larici-populina 98AG31]|uniref:Uncharacterized protein n=1 Tax=Melampsora larici-populina (strain 98AG31 / pathotype 3-4-7) TaxID=747676 RepID=F4RR56_MELLP|nr:uncharacterized protein MELLADRAFT_107857 [Melampsora larici-populina 98AG31]EGG05157.1 hypothetical protein MELLADRAFT_107857 [Melampsora larici-populina 98AG31]
MESNSDDDTDFILDPSLDTLEASTPEKRVETVERICQYINKQNTSAKAFILSYLRSTNENIVQRRKQWASVKKGWRTTEELLDEIEKLVTEKPKCKLKWDDWILRKAKSIVASQSPPARKLYINTNKLDPDFFTHDAEVQRERDVIEGMNFLHELITFKLQHELGLWSNTSASDSDTASDSDSSNVDSEPPQNYVYHKSKS